LVLRCSLLFFVCARALAFEDASQFFVQMQPHAATFGASAEGVYFTGAPRFSSLQCASCHTDGPGQVRLKLGADDPSLFDQGYQPGQTYLFEVELSNETRGLDYGTIGCTEPPGRGDTYPYQQCNSNSFALEIDAFDGPLTNVFCAGSPIAGMCPAAGATDEVIVAPDGDAVFGQRQHAGQMVLRNDALSWHLWWTAPPAGSGALTVYVAAVDGNGGAGTPETDQDPFGDDTVQASFTLREAGQPAPAGTKAGCSISGSPDPGVLLLTIPILWRWRATGCARCWRLFRRRSGSRGRPFSRSRRCG
jgi:hypothetical protein